MFSNQYTLLSEEGQELGMIQEKLNIWRFLLKRYFSPIKATMFDSDHQMVAYMKKGWAFLRPTFKVYDTQDQLLVSLKSQITLLKQKYNFFDANQNEVAFLQGNWTSWDFNISDPQGNTLCTITKKWNGVMKELFTTADSYIVEIAPNVTDTHLRTALIMSACTIDLICKEE